MACAGMTRVPRGAGAAYQGRTTRLACHVARPGAWDALPVRLC